MFFKDFVSVKRQKIKRGASQTYDTPSYRMELIKSCFDKASEEDLENMTSPLAVIIDKGYKPKIVFSHALPLKLTYDKDMETFLKIHGLWNWI